MAQPRILVINPGSTSTKLAYFRGRRRIAHEELEHPAAELARFSGVFAQLDYRLGKVMGFIRIRGIDESGVDALAARGGLMKPVKSGVYRVNEKMVEDLRDSKKRWGREHASNLGAVMALRLSREYGVPAFTADPVTVDEMEDAARISGVPEIERRSHMHALNIKEVARRGCRRLGLDPARAGLVAAHVGGGVSVAALRGGRVVDVNNALLGMGPFSPMRAGALPIGDLVRLAFSGGYGRAALERKLIQGSGLMGYLGTSDVREVEARIEAGDEKAGLVFCAMAGQVAKEIAAMASVLGGRVDAVLLTGGVANSRRFVKEVKRRAGFVARFLVYPGGFEMEALAGHAAAALSGAEEVMEYE